MEALLQLLQSFSSLVALYASDSHEVRRTETSGFCCAVLAAGSRHLFHILISPTHLPDRLLFARTIEVEFGLLKMCLLVELVTVLLELNYATTVLGLVKIGNDLGAIAVVLVLLDMLILLLLLELAAQVLVLDTFDLIAGDDDDQAAGDELELGKE